MVWITTKEASQILNIGERAVRKMSDTFICRYTSGKNGGRCLQIALPSLPEAAQTKYWAQKEAASEARMRNITGAKRAEAEYKAALVRGYLAVCGITSVKEYVARHNEETPENTITEKSFYRWMKQYKENHVAGLVDTRGPKKGSTKILPQVWETFKAFYLSPKQWSVAKCYEETKKHYPYLHIPQLRAFQIRANDVFYLPKVAKIMGREGQKAFNDKCLPYMQRSKDDINSNDVWFSDHHKLDFFVRDGKGGVVRPTLTMFTDQGSNKIISWAIRLCDGNTQSIKQALRPGIVRYGSPKELYVDNGKDFKSRELSADFPLSVVQRLGIGMIYAKPYHGQAKIIERHFGVVADRFSKEFDSWCGADAKNKPDAVKGPKEQLVKISPTLQEVEYRFSTFVEWYNNTPSKAEGLYGGTPNQAYEAKAKDIRMPEDTNAMRLLFGIVMKRKVHRNGVSAHNNTYFHSDLIQHLGATVIVMFDPDNIDTAHVFDADLREICIAPAKISTPGRHTSDEDFRLAQKQKKQAVKAAKAYMPDTHLDVHQIVAKNKAKEQVCMDNGNKAAARIKSIDSAGQAEAANTVRKQEKNEIHETLRAMYKGVV